MGPQGVFEAARLTGTNLGPWAGVPPSGLPVSLEVLILFPWDPATQRYAARRTAEGLSKPEILRCLKRYIARQLYRQLEAPPAQA